jgi:hypothetical protein
LFGLDVRRCGVGESHLTGIQADGIIQPPPLTRTAFFIVDMAMREPRAGLGRLAWTIGLFAFLGLENSIMSQGQEKPTYIRVPALLEAVTFYATHSGIPSR